MRVSRGLCALFIAFGCLCPGQALSLNGEWKVTNSNGSIRIPAQVPGGIYTDLRRANAIGDPLFRDNDVQYQWVGRENWTFSRTFEVTEEIMQKKRLVLVAHGLDTVSTILINGHLVGNTTNMFVRYQFDISSVCKVGTNSITVAFQSAVTYALQKHEEQVQKAYIIPPTCPPAVQNGECHVNYVRKMQCSFSWDWGPSFPSQGIWKNIQLESFDAAVLRDVTVVATPTTTSAGEMWNLDVKLHLDTADTTPFQRILNLNLGGNDLFSANTTLNPFPNKTAVVHLNVTVPHTMPIQRWWPNGYGAQMLYNLTVSLVDPHGSIETAKSITIGFRTVELVQTNITGSEGLSFYFVINGLPIFAKGTNWIPASVFPEEMTEVRVAHLLESARRVHMNMLRVWGGGIYESDEFYALADRLGLMIWQDMMFAVALYPTDDDFIKSVNEEVQQQVRRLQHHPSIMLWAGNNENEAGLAQNWWPDTIFHKDRYKTDYVKLYIHNIMPSVLAEDNSRPFVSSSPSNGLETEQEGWLSNNPASELYGDVHYYNYMSNAWDWTQYPRARFVSEYGFQAYPSFSALANASAQSDWTYPLGPFFQHRQHHMLGDLEIQAQISTHMKLPSQTGGIESLKDFLYLSQISQAMSIKTETEFYRRSQSDIVTGKGKTMGALYWQLNDVWQAPTWASIEYGGKWKMLHYFAQDFFAPLLPSPYEEQGQLKVSVVSDLTHPLANLTLHIETYTWKSLQLLKHWITNFQQPAQTAQVVFASPTNDLLKDSGCNRIDCFFYFHLTGQETASAPPNFLLPSSPKEVALPKAVFRVSNITCSCPLPHQCNYTIVLTTDNVALFVWLEVLGIEGTFSRNGFLLASTQTTVYFLSARKLSEDDFQHRLLIRSLADINPSHQSSHPIQ